MVSLIRSLVVVSVLLSASAFAHPFSVAVGETKVITLSQRIRGFEVGNKGLVEVTRMPKGTAVVVRGRELGKTELTMRTYDGGAVTLTLNVTSNGARAFEVDRRATRMTLSTPELETTVPPATDAVTQPSASAANDGDDSAVAAAR